MKNNPTDLVFLDINMPEVDGIVNDTRAKGAVFGRPAAQNGGSSSQGNELTKEQIEAISHRDNKPADGQPF